LLPSLTVGDGYNTGGGDDGCSSRLTTPSSSPASRHGAKTPSMSRNFSAPGHLGMTLGSRSLMSAEPGVPLNETNSRFGLTKTATLVSGEARPFHGVSRLTMDTVNNGRIRGGRHAMQGWVGAFPSKGAGVCDGRVICDGRGL